jgi:hypothetical protein
MADRLFHHLLRRQQVEVEVLLDDRDAGRFQSDRLGLDRGGHVLQLQPLAALGDVHPPHVVHQRAVLVVDGDREAWLVGGPGGDPRQTERHRQQTEPVHRLPPVSPRRPIRRRPLGRASVDVDRLFEAEVPG